MKHYILTRWNQSHNKENIYNFEGINDSEKWMEERVVLFEKYCLPSIDKQTNMDFTWILSFSSLTDPKYYEKYQNYPYIRIVFDIHPTTYLNSIYGSEINEGDWIATTRLDNDDSLHPNFIKEVKSKFKNKYELIDTLGCQYDINTQKFHDTGRTHPNSPFLTVFEKAGEFDDHNIHTCFYKSHTHLHNNMDSELIQDILYCQVIHDNNVSNKIVGEEIDIENNFFK